MGSANVADGLWHYVIAVSGVNGSALYVDGALDASDATPVVTIAPSADPLTIGAMKTDEAAARGAAELKPMFDIEARLDFSLDSFESFFEAQS